MNRSTGGSPQHLPEVDRTGYAERGNARISLHVRAPGHYHQQYLANNPNGYCGIWGCGVPFKLSELPVGENA